MGNCERAIERYRKKVLRNRGKTLIPEIAGLMVDNYAAARQIQEMVDRATRAALIGRDVSVINRVAYLSFGRQVWGRAKRFTGKTLAKELQLIRQRWQERGLDPEIMREVEEHVRRVIS